METASGAPTDVNSNTFDNVPSIDELSADQQRDLEERMEAYKTLALQSFRMSRHGKVVQRWPLPAVNAIPSAPQADGQTVKTSQPELAGMIDRSIREALIDQSGSLIMSLKPLIVNCVKDTTQNLVSTGRLYEPSHYS